MHDFLSIEKVSRHFGSLKAVDDVSLSIRQGEIFSLLGPSGCGKTTLLKMLAGFEQPDSGRIVLDGEDITALPPERRPVNTVFQNYALFPHLNVWENIAFGPKLAGKSRTQIQDAVERMLTLIQMRDHARKRPQQLSGGQRQRVAIARALVNEPRVLLLDEPLAALDLKLRQHLLAELQTIHREVGTTFIYVTHDQGEALSLSHRIAVLEKGQIAQVDTPQALYEAPANGFVASFIGDANFLTGTVEEPQSSGFVRVKVLGLDTPLVTGRPGLALGQIVKLMVRPEKLHLSLQRPANHERVNVGRCKIEAATYYGAHHRLQVRCGDRTLHVQHSSLDAELSSGQEVWISFESGAARVVD